MASSVRYSPNTSCLGSSRPGPLRDAKSEEVRGVPPTRITWGIQHMYR